MKLEPAGLKIALQNRIKSGNIGETANLAHSKGKTNPPTSTSKPH